MVTASQSYLQRAKTEEAPLPLADLGFFDQLNPVSYKKNQFVFLPGDPSRHLYVIKSGLVRTGLYPGEERSIITSILKSGDIFGEKVIFGEEKRVEFAQVIDDETELYLIPLADLQRKMSDTNNLCFSITQIIGKKLLKTHRRLETLVFNDAQSRIIQLLMELVKENGYRVGYEMFLPRFFTHKEIAQMTNTSRQTVTTVLNKLKSLNLIYIRKHQLLVRDMESLEKLVVSE